VLILGAGEMAHQALRLIRTGDRGRRVVVANRTPQRAEIMVENDPAAGTLPLSSVIDDFPAVGTIVAVTSSQDPLLEQSHIVAARNQIPSDEPLLVVDLAMPPNVDPVIGEIEGVLLHGIEQMRDEAERNRHLRLAEMDRCEKLVEHQLTILRRHLLDRALSPAARSLHQSFKEMADRAVRHSLGKDLGHLDEGDQKAIERMADGLAKRLVQVPLKGLKGAAWNHSSAVIDGFLKGLDGKNGSGEDPES
jgi:glutamyl-tRNA reductase